MQRHRPTLPYVRAPVSGPAFATAVVEAKPVRGVPDSVSPTMRTPGHNATVQFGKHVVPGVADAEDAELLFEKDVVVVAVVPVAPGKGDLPSPHP